MSYPNEAGWKARETSQQSAKTTKAATLRAKVIEELKKHVFGASPEVIAKELGESVLSIRPRLSELVNMGLVVDSGRRDKSEFGKSTIIWLYNGKQAFVADKQLSK